MNLFPLSHSLPPTFPHFRHSLPLLRKQRVQPRNFNGVQIFVGETTSCSFLTGTCGSPFQIPQMIGRRFPMFMWILLPNGFSSPTLFTRYFTATSIEGTKRTRTHAQRLVPSRLRPHGCRCLGRDGAQHRHGQHVVVGLCHTGRCVKSTNPKSTRGHGSPHILFVFAPFL